MHLVGAAAEQWLEVESMLRWWTDEWPKQWPGGDCSGSSCIKIAAGWVCMDQACSGDDCGVALQLQAGAAAGMATPALSSLLSVWRQSRAAADRLRCKRRASARPLLGNALQTATSSVSVELAGDARLRAGVQIRNTASVGGNIVTGSPISDMNPLYMAARAVFVVGGRGTPEREVRRALWDTKAGS